MFRVALTGGIATGKSYVAGQFRRHGVPVVDADILSREVVAPGTTGLAVIERRFGADVIGADGQLNRERLGEMVFADAHARHDLEAIIHPAVRELIERFFTALPGTTPYAVADIPLLFETSREGDFAKVVVVACPSATQLTRLVERGLTFEQAEQRMAAQWPIDAKVDRADYLIYTGGSYEQTDQQVIHVAETLLRLARATS